MVKFFNNFCVVLCTTIKNGKWKTDTVNTLISMENVLQHNDVALTNWEHSANIMFCMCFEFSPCFSFWQATLGNTVWRKAFSLVQEKGMFCLIQGPCIRQNYSEELAIISLLLQKFPFKHKATVNKYVDTVDRWTDRHTDIPKKTGS